MLLRPMVFQTTRRPDSAKDSPSFTMHPCHHPPLRRLLTSFARARMLFNLTCLRYTTFLDAIACASNTRALISSASLGQWCLNCLHLSEMTAISGVSGIIWGSRQELLWMVVIHRSSFRSRRTNFSERCSWQRSGNDELNFENSCFPHLCILVESDRDWAWIDYSPQRESTDQVIDTQDLGSVDS